MGRIKSSLEIALERTESIKSDKSAASLFETKQKGKRIASGFLDGEIKSIEDELKKLPKEEIESVKQGMFDLFISQIKLPGNEDEIDRIENASKGVQLVLNNNRFNSMAKQFKELLRQYLSESSQYEEAIKRQYAPKLRQKEEEIARRLGRQVQLDPFQDPEFVAFYNQHINALKEKYQGAIDELLEEASRLREGNPVN